MDPFNIFFAVSETAPAPTSHNRTIYASPKGNDSNPGTSPTLAKTFLGAAGVARPGSVVCLLPGTYSLNASFTPPTSGTPTAWIVYKNCGTAPVNFVWSGPADASPMFKLGSGKFPTGPAYLEFRGLHLDGAGNAADGFFCRGGHHLRFVNNTIMNTGGSGIASIQCDYLTVDHNIVEHNGYIPASTRVPQWYSWTSGISLNSNQWFDRYTGFHSVISNNIVSGEVDQSAKHTDGNGIILDLSNGSYEYKSANTPPALVINNVVFENGGHCIEAFTVTNFWIVNNTCYFNTLDPAMAGGGSITTNNSREGYIINNIAVSSKSRNPAYDQENNNADVRYLHNLFHGSSNRLKDLDDSSFLEANPEFVNPPSWNSSRERTRPSIPELKLQSGGLELRESSPALRKGIDPALLPHLPAAILADLQKYLYKDVEGRPRPQGGPFDLGAYQESVPKGN
ncbi:MAG TPA: right-handed parallel beta-helix repeat-containing protein [Candidatus Acidoferrum sp.]|nr:right-handed parallel beta-helix repeat-containing protein [Candidatus Acidoferrum sp.]